MWRQVRTSERSRPIQLLHLPPRSFSRTVFKRLTVIPPAMMLELRPVGRSTQLKNETLPGRHELLLNHLRRRPCRHDRPRNDLCCCEATGTTRALPQARAHHLLDTVRFPICRMRLHKVGNLARNASHYRSHRPQAESLGPRTRGHATARASRPCARPDGTRSGTWGPRSLDRQERTAQGVRWSSLREQVGSEEAPERRPSPGSGLAILAQTTPAHG